MLTSLEKEDAIASRAALAQEVERLRAKETDVRREGERELKQRDTSIAGLERAVDELNAELIETQQQVSLITVLEQKTNSLRK